MLSDRSVLCAWRRRKRMYASQKTDTRQTDSYADAARVRLARILRRLDADVRIVTELIDDCMENKFFSA